jgi:hypothetical protein
VKALSLSFIALLSILWAPGLKAQSYTLVDLEALEKERSYDEFFAHALDIRPSERTDYWKTMVQNMAEGHLQLLLRKNRLEHADFLHMQKLTDWSVLKSHEFFRLKRQELGLKWLAQCLQDNGAANSPCWQDVLAYWEKDRQDPDIAGRLLTLLSPYLASALPVASNPTHQARMLVTPLFILAPVLKSPLAELQCQKPEFQDVLWNSMRESFTQNFKNRTFSALMSEIATPECWKALIPGARQNWKTGSDELTLQLSYLLLKFQNQLEPLEQDMFYVYFLLNSPARGETFNLAWGRLLQLKDLPRERDKILSAFKLWRPLPGNIFTDLDLSKRRSVTRHVQQNFPEYIDHYALTCVDFYGGKRRFPEGNPALHCRELFDLAADVLGILPAPTIEAFKRAIL